MQLFDFNGQAVRTVMIEGEPWFVGNDVCGILELGNPRTSLAKLDDDERSVHSMDTGFGVKDHTLISESGMYSLTLRSRKPQAKAFKKWVTSEVLPSIRKTGAYAIPDSALALPEVLVAGDEMMNLTDAGTALGLGRDGLINRLFAERRIVRRLGGRAWVPRTSEVRAGRMVLKYHAHGPNTRPQVFLTPKGVQTLANQWGVVS